MNKIVGVVIGLCLLCSCSLIGCGPKKASSSSEAIEKSKTIQTVQAQVNYLVSQAKAFYNSKDFQDVVTVSQYVLANLDKNSQQAKDLLEQAKKELTATAQKKFDEMKGKVGFGK